jgi:hypothetical protein
LLLYTTFKYSTGDLFFFLRNGQKSAQVFIMHKLEFNLFSEREFSRVILATIKLGECGVEPELKLTQYLCPKGQVASDAIVIKSKCLVHQVDTIKVSSSFAAQICVLGQAGRAFVPSHCQLAANVAGSVSRFIPLSLFSFRSLNVCVCVCYVFSVLHPAAPSHSH